LDNCFDSAFRPARQHLGTAGLGSGVFKRDSLSGNRRNTLSNPQFITGGPYEGIFADMDGVNDTTDVYALHWIGGDFLAEFTSDLDPEIALYTFSQTLLGSAIGTNNFTLQMT
jgi:hypothetical protein